MSCVKCRRNNQRRFHKFLFGFFVVSVTSLTSSAFVLVSESQQQHDRKVGLGDFGYQGGSKYVYRYLTETGMVVNILISLHDTHVMHILIRFRPYG